MKPTFPLLLVLLCVLFAAIGFILIPYLGIQNDEALFASAIYPPVLIEYQIGRVPLMLMSYLGCLKTWFYLPIFQVFEPGVYSTRAPVVIFGAATLALFGWWCRRALGVLPAAIATLFLATDATFQVTTTFDWGPVAFQHLLWMLTVFAVWRHAVTGRNWWIAIGGLTAGLALWDKALSVWMLSGTVGASVWMWPSQAKRLLQSRASLLLLAGSLIGAAPFLIYNLARLEGGATRNIVFSRKDMPMKLKGTVTTFEGGSQLGALVRDVPFQQPAAPTNALERASVWVNQQAGAPRAGYFFAAFLLSILLLPVAAGSPLFRWALWALAIMILAWLQMFVTHDAGTSAHHIGLLWPLPHLFVAAAWVAAARRFHRVGQVVLLLLVTLVAASNLIVLNQYLAQAVRFGSGTVWTDAIYPLEEWLRREQPDPVVALDWGIHNSLQLLGAGSIPSEVGWEYLMRSDPHPAVVERFENFLNAPGAVFITHVPEEIVFPAVREKFEQALARRNLLIRQVAIVRDRVGRPVFEILRVAPASTL